VFVISTKRHIAAAIAMALLAAPFAGPVPSIADDAAPTDTQAACPTPDPGFAQCYAVVRTDLAQAAGTGATPATTKAGALGPDELRSAYALPTGSQGSGLTVAVVDAFDLPTAEADLAAYRTQFGLPACTTANGCFRKVNQSGVQGSYPAADAGWGGEIALDIDMVSAVCPNCRILLVEATNNGLNNLGASVNTAVSLGAVAVSNSYGGPEWAGEAGFDSYYNHPGVAITVSTGDCGYDCSGTNEGPAYPAASPYVVAVGGTSLSRDTSARGWKESAWSYAGSGCSVYASKPDWQHDTGCAKRSQADVAAVADPSTGVWVYVAGKWCVFGGTSVAAPIIASVFSLAGAPKAGTYPASYLYASPAALNDVTAGNNDVKWHDCTVLYLCSGVAGYDGPTGLGTPRGTTAFAPPATPGQPSNVAATAADAAVALAWTAPAAIGGAITGYTVTETEHGLGVVTCASTSATACTVGGLTNGTEYTFTVHAANAQGAGPESAPSNSVTPLAATAPDKPATVTAVAAIGSANVSWAAASPNRSAITGYTATSDPDARTCKTAGALGCTVAGLTNGQPYTFTVTATNGVGSGEASDPSAAVTPVVGDTYHPIQTVRLLDTRYGNGLSGKLIAGQPATFQVAGRTRVPLGATAVTADATVVNATSAGSIYIGASPVADPPTSSMTFNRCDTTGYGVTVSLSPTGTLSLTYIAPIGTADLVIDVTGYFTADTAGDTYHALKSPARLLDTRYGNGLSSKLKANAPRTFAVVGRGGVPTNAKAVTGNLTVVNSTHSGAVYLGPDAILKPSSSTINFARKQIRGNSLTVALSGKGTVSATFMAANGNTTDLVFDVTGYYTADTTGATFMPISPVRLLDTRVGNGLESAVAANSPDSIQITGRGGIPSSASGIAGTLSAVNQTSSYAVFVGPIPTPKPATSALNFQKTDLNANGVTVALDTSGMLSVTFMSAAGNKTDMTLDVTGYFVDPVVTPTEWTADLYDPRADRWQDPDYTACTAATTMSMLNEISYSGTDATLTWTLTTAYATQEAMLAYERGHMTMLSSSAGTDPHGWRNALNYYGWGSMNAGVYRDSSYTSFDAAAKAAVSALARYHKPVGILALAGGHAEFITGYEVLGDDPSTGSMNFTIVGVDLTDPLAYNAHRDLWLTLADWRAGSTWVRFSPYLQTDSPYTDPVDGKVGYDEWYGNWVIIDPVK
jgi:Fibronectin type III domain